MRPFLLLFSFTILFCSLQNDNKNSIQSSVKNLGIEITICKITVDKKLVINKDNPFLRVKLETLKKSRQNNILEVNIIEVKNPDLEPLTFHLYIELPSESLDLNSISLYPSNQGGKFNFRLSQYWGKISKANHVNIILKLDLEKNQRLSDKVFVEFEKPIIQ